MMNRATVDELEKQMQRADVRMDALALQVGDIQRTAFAGDDVDDGDVEVDRLLRSVDAVRVNYKHLRDDIAEVQHLQRQLSSSLQLQIRTMQSKFDRLKAKIVTQGGRVATTTTPPPPPSPSPMPNLLLDVPTDLHEARFPHY